MQINTQMIYIFWSCRDKKEAKKIIHGLLNQHLIACASIFPKVESIYRWESKIEASQEVKVLLKTRHKNYFAIQSYIQEHGSYEIPEIVQVDITHGNPKYVTWLLEETTPN